MPRCDSRLRVCVILLAICTTGISAISQRPKVLAPHDPVPAKMAKTIPLPAAQSGSIVGGPWMVDANFRSTVYVKNLIETSTVTATPVLYLSNGMRYVLPKLNLDPSGIATVDVNATLKSLGIAPYAELSGYLELDYSWPWVPICATLKAIDSTHSLIFYYSFLPSKRAQLPNQPPPSVGPKRNIIEGMWWKQEPNVTGFVALTNTGSKPVDAQVDLSDDLGAGVAQHKITITPHGTKLINLVELDSASTAQGGIRVTYTADSDPVLVNGGLQDQAVGYSAVIPFAEAAQAPANSKSTIAELGLMTGPADPMLRFPAATTFTPYTVLRNISGALLTATPTLWWMSAGITQSAQLGQLSLAPYQTKVLNVPSLLAAVGLKSFSGSVNLVFDVEGAAGGMLVSGGAVDQTESYVFGVIPRGVTWSAGKSLSYWSIGNGDDTMVTLWNPADEAQDLIFRLDYTGGHYALPVHLAPRATQMFNISDIVNSQTPDADGNVVPLAVHEGSAELTGIHDEIEHILVAMDAGIYNVQKATCGGYSCETCNGVASSSVTDDSWIDSVNGTHALVFTETYNTGSQYNVTGQSYWNSNTPSVATVSSGVVTGVSSGSATISALDTYSEPGYVDDECGYYLPACPIYTFNPGGGASGNVCGLSITTSSVTANCSSGQQQTKGVTASVSGGSSCEWVYSSSSCTAGNASGQVGPLGNCGLNSGSQYPSNPQAQVPLFAGPGSSGSQVGTFDVLFTIYIPANGYGVNTETQGTIPVFCQ